MEHISLFSQSLINSTYTFLDVETTGLYPLLGDKIIEIAMLKYEKGAQIDFFHSLINPLRTLPEEATKINKINEELIKNAPSFDSLAEKILEFISDSIIVAHNASFDLSFLSVEFAKCGILFKNWKAIDTLKIANDIFMGQRNKLESVMKRYNLSSNGELHRALNDTEILKNIFFELIEEEKIRNKKLEDLIKEYGFNGEDNYDLIPEIIKEAIKEKKDIKGEYKTRENRIIKLISTPILPIWINGTWYLYAKDKKTQADLYLYCKNYYNLEII